MNRLRSFFKPAKKMEQPHQQTGSSSPGVTRVQITLDLPPGSVVSLTLEAQPASRTTDFRREAVQADVTVIAADGTPVEVSPAVVSVLPAASVGQGDVREHLLARLGARLRVWLERLGRLLWLRFGLEKPERTLLWSALVVYLIVRLIGLSDWPIYFFTDEAVQTVMAADFVNAGLRNYDKEFLPTYFAPGPSYNLSSVSVYVQVLPYLVFGKSVYVTRLVSMLFSALGALFLALTLKHVFKLRHAWLGLMLLSVAPAWFLHSRTAFETVEMSAFFAGFLYCYMRYRQGEYRYLFGAIVSGAFVFYTYNPGQLIIAVAGLLLFLLDLPYHWQQRRTIGRGFVLLLVLVLPYLRYWLSHPTSVLQHLAQRAPYWVENIPLQEKLGRYFAEYLNALSPLYWFWPNQMDLDRHLMKGYGHLFLLSLPFVVIGLLLALRNIRQPIYRTVLVALFAAPVGSALVQVGITRLLCTLIPQVLLMALGLIWCLEWLEKLLNQYLQARKPGRYNRLSPALAGGVFAALVFVHVWMLVDALRNGPLWYQDYTLGGMQYGARQLFDAARKYVSDHPGSRLIVSPSWTNGTDAVKRFFISDDLPISLGSVEGYLFQRLPLDDQTVFVMMPNEYQQVLSGNKFTAIHVDQTLPYPNGLPGFYFVRMRYAENVDEILDAEREQRRQLQQIYLIIDGKPAQLGYSMLDIGPIVNVFDNDENTLARTLEANPFVLDIDFDSPRSISGLKMYIGSTRIGVTARLEMPDQSSAEFSIQKQASVADPRLELNFDRSYTVQRLRLEVQDLSQGEPGHVHIWEIQFK